MSFCPRAFALTWLACLLVCGAGTAQEKEPDWSKVQIKASKVSGNIYLLEGQGGNIAASVGEDGIVIVDDEFAPLAEKIQAALHDLKITDKPVRFVINTHYHGDHTGGGFPFIDVASGGSVQGMADGVEKAIAQLPADVKVIPGHGQLSNLDDVRAYVRMLRDTTAAVQKALDAHKTVDQMKQEKILAPWAKWSGDFVNQDTFIETIYNSLMNRPGPFVKHN